MGEYVKLCGKIGPRDDNGEETLCRDADTHIGHHTYLSKTTIEDARELLYGEATEDAKESESFTALINAAGSLPTTGMASAEPPPQEPRCKTCAATCDLAASEIPGFATNRDKHRCPKLHRDKPSDPCPECCTTPTRRETR